MGHEQHTGLYTSDAIGMGGRGSSECNRQTRWRFASEGDGETITVAVVYLFPGNVVLLA